MDTIYLGNLPYSSTKEDVREFIDAGVEVTVKDVRIVLDSEGRHKGFGFATLGSASEVVKAVDALNGGQLSGRTIVVNPARERAGGGGKGGGGKGGVKGGAFAKRRVEESKVKDGVKSRRGSDRRGGARDFWND